MALKYVTASKPGTYKAVANTAKYKAPTYADKYGAQVDSALNNLVNWSYDPMKDASYQALAKVYNQRGNTAAKDTMGQAAMLNGGYNSSYATTAAAQQRSIYNQELASLIPDLEDRAYGRARDSLSALRDADDAAYGRYRDDVGDAQWKFAQDYQAWRDQTADRQWQYSTNAANYQWAKNFNMDVYAAKQAQKKNSSGGGGGGRSGGGGGSYGGSSGSSSSSSKAQDILNNATTQKGTKNDPSGQYNKEYLKKIAKKNLFDNL